MSGGFYLVISDEFLAMVGRDYSADVARINLELNLKGDGLLVDHVPPHTFVGNIDKMENGNCILVIGINPFLWDDQRFERANIELPNHCLTNYRNSGDVNALSDWINWQKEYFLSNEINATHFKKISRLIGPRYFSLTHGDDNWRDTLYQHIVEVDIVPYYSIKAQINDHKLAKLYRHNSALITHLNLIKWIIKKIQPRWIQVNGKAGWETICQELLNGEGEIIDDAGDKGSEIMVGHTNVSGNRIPVLLHKFIGGLGGANSHIQRNQVMDSWDKWLSNNS